MARSKSNVQWPMAKWYPSKIYKFLMWLKLKCFVNCQIIFYYRIISINITSICSMDLVSIFGSCKELVLLSIHYVIRMRESLTMDSDVALVLSIMLMVLVMKGNGKTI